MRQVLPCLIQTAELKIGFSKSVNINPSTFPWNLGMGKMPNYIVLN